MPDQKPKVIIIDDDNEKRCVYAEKFVAEGFLVEEAINGKEGLKKIIQSPPDLIFTGIQMPEMDGFTMVEQIKKDSALGRIPIMINSHLGRKEDQEHSRSLGCNEFIYYGMVPFNEVVERAKKLVWKVV